MIIPKRSQRKSYKSQAYINALASDIKGQWCSLTKASHNDVSGAVLCSAEAKVKLKF